MKVIIKEKEWEYQSDFPTGWLFSAGDYFKFPVQIGTANNQCFIKRFEKKSPEKISGWHFMTSLQGKYEPNLPRLHDIVSVKENEKDVHYVFYQFIEGSTLDNLKITPAQIRLQTLTDDISSAFDSLNKYNVWFADFCEKNIFCGENGRFYLIDLDSVQPTSELPTNDIFGSKDYWVLVLNFYKDILGYKNLKPTDLSGTLLTNLQLVFLILHIKILEIQNQVSYKSRRNFDDLPTILDNLEPSFKQLFEKLFHEPPQTIQKKYGEEIRNLISQKIIPLTQLPQNDAPENEIVIHHFQANKDKVTSDEPFELRWEIENASSLALYKNGKLAAEKINLNQKNIQIQEKTYDGKARNVAYYLLITNKNGTKQSDSVEVLIQPIEKKPDLPVIKSFVANKNKVEHEENFTLNWEVEKATEIELYRNGKSFKKFNATETSIQLEEKAFDGKENHVDFQLKAANKDGKIESDLIKIAIEPKTIEPKPSEIDSSEPILSEPIPSEINLSEPIPIKPTFFSKYKKVIFSVLLVASLFVGYSHFSKPTAIYEYNLEQVKGKGNIKLIPIKGSFGFGKVEKVHLKNESPFFLEKVTVQMKFLDETNNYSIISIPFYKIKPHSFSDQKQDIPQDWKDITFTITQVR